MKVKTRAMSFVVLMATLFISTIEGTTNGMKTSGAANRLPSWIDKDKVRAGYVYINDDPQYAALMCSKGLNSLLVKGEFQLRSKYKKTVVLYRAWSQTAKQLKLHTFLAYNLQPDPNSFSYRRAVYSDGTTDMAPCLRDDRYWDNYLVRLGKVIAALSLEKNLQIDGVVLDCELYGNSLKKYTYGKACYCDSCFSSYLLANHYTGEQLPPVSEDGRREWLERNGLLNDYNNFLGREVEYHARKLETEIHNINPNLVIGLYPTPEDWARRAIARGSGTQEFPILLFATESYYKGGHRSIPENTTAFSRQLNINAVYVAGYLFRRYGSDALEENMYEAARKCNGYWLFRMRLLWGRYEEGESLAEGSMEDYWKAINKANVRIDTMIAEKRAVK